MFYQTEAKLQGWRAVAVFEDLYEYAEKLINLRSEASESLAELRELQKGRLVVAANEFTVLYLLQVVAEFRRLHLQ